MAAFSYFVDKLSAETRVQIYGYVFGTNEYAKRANIINDGDVKQEHQDNRLLLFEPAQHAYPPCGTSIFSVNKKISAEALETFYNRKTIRLTFAQLWEDRWCDYQDHIRRLEIVDCVYTLESGSTTAQSRALIQAGLSIALNLPRIKSVTVLSDSLAYVPDLRDAMTVREWADAAELDGVVCEDVGLYKLLGRYSGVKIANSKLRKMWPGAASMPAGYKASKEARRVLDQWRLSGNHQSDIMAWASQTSLRIWVGMWEELVTFTTQQVPATPFAAVATLNLHFIYLGSWAKTVRNPQGLPRSGKDFEVPLHTLGPQYDPQTLEWATELIATNIETYRFNDGEDARACWPEVDSCEGIGARRARMQNGGQAAAAHTEDSDDSDDDDEADDAAGDNCVMS